MVNGVMDSLKELIFIITDISFQSTSIVVKI